MQALQSLDQQVHDWFAACWPYGRLSDYVRDLSGLGSHPALVLTVVMALGLLLLQRNYGRALYVALVAGGGALLLTGIKLMVRRQRPDGHYDLVRLSETYSFPSGHAWNSAVIYLTLALLVSAHLPDRRVRAYVLGGTLVLVFLIGVSRVYLGVHYLTDVVAGWAGGLAWALACHRLGVPGTSTGRVKYTARGQE